MCDVYVAYLDLPAGAVIDQHPLRCFFESPLSLNTFRVELEKRRPSRGRPGAMPEHWPGSEDDLRR